MRDKKGRFVKGNRALKLSLNHSGKLIILWPLEKRLHGEVIWRCICACGNVIEAKANLLRREIVKSCGCLLGEMNRKRLITHGSSKTRLFKIWVGIRKRCRGKTNRSQYYKGVKICSEWGAFVNFKKWALSSGYKNSLQIDRINSALGYYPENCQWITHSEHSKKTCLKRWRQKNDNI